MPATLQETIPALTSNGHAVNPDGVDWLRDSTEILNDVPALQQRMSQDGYLFLPGLLNKEWVLDARRSITDVLKAEGCLDPAFPSIESIAQPNKNPGWRPELTRNPAVIRLLYSGAMMNFFAAFLAGEVRHFDFTWLRTVMPGRGTNPHCDIVYMGRGTHNLYTAWTPLGDVPFEQGGLMVLEGSNNHQRLKQTYGQTDVDSFCSNRQGRAGQDFWARKGGGSLGSNPNQIRRSIGGQWRTAEFKSGDVLIFSMFTIHCSADNHSNRVRLSTDSRYQLASEPVDERWVGENPIAHGKDGKRGRIC